MARKTSKVQAAPKAPKAPKEPEITEPEITEPEITEPEITEPEITEPETTEPETTEPETTADAKPKKESKRQAVAEPSTLDGPWVSMREQLFNGVNVMPGDTVDVSDLGVAKMRRLIQRFMIGRPGDEVTGRQRFRKIRMRGVRREVWAARMAAERATRTKE